MKILQHLPIGMNRLLLDQSASVPFMLPLYVPTGVDLSIMRSSQEDWDNEAAVFDTTS